MGTLAANRDQSRLDSESGALNTSLIDESLTTIVLQLSLPCEPLQIRTLGKREAT